MKEKILEIVYSPEAADKLAALFEAEIEKRMPTERVIDDKAIVSSGGLDMWYQGFLNGCEWFRSRMEGEEK